MLLAMRPCRVLAFVWLLTVSFVARPQSADVVVRPREIPDLLVNPGMGITTFQRFNGDAINPGRTWSEVGPEAQLPAPSGKPDFPDTAIAYLRWFWSQIEPEPGKYHWDILDRALEEAHRRHQTLAIRLMPYDERHPLPAWYQSSGARRGVGAQLHLPRTHGDSVQRHRENRTPCKCQR